MTVLGIDPSLARTGFALVAWGPGGDPVLLQADACETDAESGRPVRLMELQCTVEAYNRHGVTFAAYENGAFFGRASAGGMLAVAEARGVCLAACATIGLECRAVTPAAAKKAVTGKGTATKAEVRAAIQRIFDLAKPLKADESDAAAVALAALGFAVPAIPKAKQPRKARAKGGRK